MKEELRFKRMEQDIQERLLCWVVRRDEAERILLKRVSMFFLSRKLFKDILGLYVLACEGVKECLVSVESLKKMRRLQYRIFVIERIERRRKKIEVYHEISNS